MNAALDLRLDTTDAFGCTLTLDAKNGAVRSGNTTELKTGRSAEPVNVLGYLNAKLDSCDLHHSTLTLSSDADGSTWYRTVTLSLGRMVSLTLPDFLQEGNAGPQMNPIADLTVQAGTTGSASFSATDADPADTLVFSGENVPAFGTLVDNGNRTGSVDFAPAAGSEGTYVITVHVTDGNVTDSESFTLTVTAAGAAGIASEEASEESDEDKESDSEDYSFDDLKVSELDKVLEKRDLSTEGLKADKVKRLRDYYDDSEDDHKAEIRKEVEEL